MNNDLISREDLKKRFERLVDETIPYGGVTANDMRELIDNAPTVEPEPCKCEECNYRKFTETFNDGVIDLMNKNDITSIEQLSEKLKGVLND